MNDPPTDRTPTDEVPQEDPAEQERPTELADRFAAAHDDPGSGEEIPSQIGPYRVLEPLGRGAFGNVYLCQEKDAPRRKLAVKVIRAGMDTREVLARFEAEKNAMFLMDHPSIARVIGAGSTDDGKPYFAMEYVPGQPISRFCSTEKLSIDERLRLFGEVCRAIQHAHAKAVVHRDLKPSNILAARIDGKIQVKIIDFGMVKSLQQPLADQTLHTMAGQAVGTFEYMSPEQARSQGGDVDTRTDIYALGAVLYELLTGELAFAGIRERSYEEILKVISEQDPPRPSLRLSQLDALQKSHRAEDLGTDLDVLRRSLGNELDWVVMKALEKDRDRRYQTAQEMAAEIDRYLSGDAIEARPPSAVYRLKKTMRRHRGVLTATMVVFLALIGGMTWALIERDRAAEETDKARIAKEGAQQSLVKEHQAVEEAVAARNLAERSKEQAEEARRETEANAYMANVQIAAAWLDLDEPSRARVRLDDCPEHLRNWEWGWLDQRQDGSIAILRGHTKSIKRAHFSPDGARILTVSDDRVRLWDTATGEGLGMIQRGPGRFENVTFSPDGTSIATTSLLDVHARVWDAVTGLDVEIPDTEVDREIETLRQQAATIEPMKVGGQAKGDFVVFDLALMVEGETVWERLKVEMKIGAIDRGWEIVRDLIEATAGASQDQVFEQSTQIEDDSQFVDHRGKSGTHRLTLRGAKKRVVPALTEAFFESQGVGSESELRNKIRKKLRANRKLQELWALEAFEEEVGRGFVVFSPDGTRLLTHDEPHETSPAQIWDLNNGKSVGRFQAEDLSQGFAFASFSADGARIFTFRKFGLGGYKEPEIWDANTGERFFNGGWGVGVGTALSPDRTRIATAGNLKGDAARIWAVPGTKITEAEVDREIETIREQTMRFEPTGREEYKQALGDRVVYDSVVLVEGKPIWERLGMGFKIGETPRSWRPYPDLVEALLGAHIDESVEKVIPYPDDGPEEEFRGKAATMRLTLRGVMKKVLPELDEAFFESQGVESEAELRDKVRKNLRGNRKAWEVVTLQGPFDEACRGVLFSPDGAHILVIYSAGLAQVWDVNTGKSLALLQMDSESLRGGNFIFSPDGTRIATTSYDRPATGLSTAQYPTVRVWDAATGNNLVTLHGYEGPIYNTSFSPDGTRILTVGNQTARLWHVNSGELLTVLQGHAERIRYAEFSPDGTRIVTASDDGTARLWDAVTSDIRISHWQKNGELRKLASDSYFAVFSPDGTRILTVLADTDPSDLIGLGNSFIRSIGHPYTATVLDANTGERITRLRERSERLPARRGDSEDFSWAAFSPDGAHIVTISDGTARVWDAITGETLAILQGHKKSVSSAVFSPDGTRIVTASADATARVWDAVSGESLVVLQGHKKSVSSAVFSPDGTRILTASNDDTARVWDVATGTSLVEIQGVRSDYPRSLSQGFAMSNRVSFSPDGRRIVTADGWLKRTARVLDATTGEVLMVLEGHTSSPQCAAFSPDGTRIVTSEFGGGEVRIWDAATGDSLAVLQHHDRPDQGVRRISTTFTPDSARIITVFGGMEDLGGPAQIWDVNTGTMLVELGRRPKKHYSTAFSPDGTRIVTASASSTASITTSSTLSGAAVHIYDSVPYRERYPAIVRARQAAALMKPRVLQRLTAGEEPLALRRSLAADSSLSREQLHAGLAAILAFEESQK